MKRFFLFIALAAALALFVIAAGTASAASVKTETGGAALKLSMKEALSLALAQNVSVVNASEDVRRAAGESQSQSSALLPKIDLAGSAAGTSDNSAGTQNTDERTLGAQLSYTLYNGGKNRALSEQGKLGVAQAGDYLYDTRESIVLDVWKAYCETLYRASVVTAVKSALDYYERAVEEETKRVEVGVATNLDLSRMRQQRAGSQAEYISAKNDLDSARIALCRLLQLAPETRLELTDGLHDDLSLAGTPLPESISVREYHARALERRGDYKKLAAQRKIDEKEIVVAASALKPSVSFSGGYGYDYKDTSDKILESKDEWSAKLSLSVPLFDGGKGAGDVTAARSKLTQSVNSLRDKEEAILAEITDCRLSLASAAESAAAAVTEVSFAKESLGYAEVGYKEGVNSQLDVIQARSDLTDADKKLAGYLKEYRSALASLWRAGGELIEKTIGATDGGNA